MCEKRLATISEIFLILLIIIFKVIKVYYIKSFDEKSCTYSTKMKNERDEKSKMKNRVHIAQQ